MTTGPRSRKVAVFAFAVTAAVLTTASAALACVAFYGDMRVTNPGLPNTLGVGKGSLVTGNGGPALHGYCPNPTLSRLEVGMSGEPLFAPDVMTTGSLKVEVWPASACNASGLNKLNNGLAEVWMYNRAGFKGADGLGWNFQLGTGCFLQSSISHKLGTMNVTSGVGSGTFSLAGLTNALGQSVQPNALPTEASSICVGAKSLLTSPTLIDQGIFAPVQVI